MKKNQPLLSICILAYNKADALKRLLSSLVAQDSNNLEVVVSNDGSIDETDRVAISFKKKFRNFVYMKNSRNIGFDLNLLQVLSKAHGKFCWTVGDGEYFPLNTVRNVMAVVAKNPQAAYFLANYNIAFHDKSLTPCIRENQDLSFMCGQDFFRYKCNDRWKIGVLGAFCISIYAGIYNKKYLSDSLFLELKKKYNNTFLIHLALILEIIANNSVYFISKPQIVTVPDTFNPRVTIRDAYLKHMPKILDHYVRKYNYSKMAVTHITWYYKLRLVLLSVKFLLLRFRTRF